MVLEAVLGLKEPYGSSNASIATYIEVKLPPFLGLFSGVRVRYFVFLASVSEEKHRKNTNRN